MKIHKIILVIIIVLLSYIAYINYYTANYLMNSKEKVIMYGLNSKLNSIMIYLTKQCNIRYVDFDISKAPLGKSAYVLYYEYIYIDPYKQDSKTLYNSDTLTYVALHELTHIIIRSKKHNKQFVNTFLNLLRIAKKLKLIDMSKVAKYYIAE